MQENFSASYGGTSENFTVRISTGTGDIPVEIEPLLCVVQNIIQRGNPTLSSDFLRAKFGSPPNDKIPLLDKTNLRWNNILGDAKNLDNPAKIFYNEILPRYLGEYAFARNLILPEAPFESLLEKTERFNGQNADFYLPQIRRVIEIDGDSHNSPAQIRKDAARDRALNDENISVTRIKTTDLRNETAAFQSAMKNLAEEIAASPEIARYRDALEILPSDIHVRYDAVMRLQIAILFYLRKNPAAPELKIKIAGTDVENLAELLNAAYEDLTHWFDAVAALARIDAKFPQLVIGGGKNFIALDFYMFRRYADTDEYFSGGAKKIYVRTDYFSGKNYYRVAAAAPIRYKIAVEIDNEDTAGAPDLESLRFLLKNIFGLNGFRGGQLPIIKHILGREDTIGILPTGTGKSLCYQLSALLQPGLTLVIAPLISLMQDQKKGLDKRHINCAAYIFGGLDGKAQETLLNNFANGRYQFLLISPERTQNEKFRQYLLAANEKFNLATAVIDEAHCLSEWGHDFRISYLMLIPTLREYCAKTCLLGLTATASQAVLTDLKAEFGIDGSGVKALTSMDRDELVFRRINFKSNADRDKKILELIGKHTGFYIDEHGRKKNSVGLVFCLTVGKFKDKPALNRIVPLIKNNFSGSVETFHGKMNPADKEAAQNVFMAKDFAGVMVCTTAFGMGIDKENIKFTINTALPKSIEEFYQQAGRAGRDADKSEKSYCYILYMPEDAAKSELIEEIFNPNTEINRRKTLSGQLKNDLNSVMYFWNLSKYSVAEEYKKIRARLAELEDDWRDFDFHSEGELRELQYVLYKIALLGIVKSWTINYSSLESGTVSVEYVGFVEENVRRELLRYIHKHDAEFSLEGKNIRAEKWLEDLIKLLIEWTNDTILYSRLQSIYNMMKFCSEEISDAEFRVRINDYFKYTDQTVILDAIAQNPREFKNWFAVLENESESVSKAKSILAALMRYLESYGNNTGLNYLSGMLRLICGEFRGNEEWRLETSLQNIKSYDGGAEIIGRTIALAKKFNAAEKNMFSEIFLKVYPERVEEIYRELQDANSLSAIVDGQAARLSKVLEAYTRGKIFKQAEKFDR
mgnify:CR=1 FL=1